MWRYLLTCTLDQSPSISLSLLPQSFILLSSLLPSAPSFSLSSLPSSCSLFASSSARRPFSPVGELALRRRRRRRRPGGDSPRGRLAPPSSTGLRWAQFGSSEPQWAALAVDNRCRPAWRPALWRRCRRRRPLLRK